MTPIPQSSRAGWSLIEVVLALSLFFVLLLKGMSLVQVASEGSADDTSTILVEEKARILLERIALAIMGTHRDTLVPASPSPLSSDEIHYQVHLGIEKGEVVWGDPEAITHETESTEVVWAQNPDTQKERRIVWSRAVAPFLEGEVPNGEDDNGNGLVDEKGLSFTVDRNAVTIRLTLSVPDGEGETKTHTVETTVTCRHLSGGGGAS